jgi:hypothetical protein
MNQLTKKDLRLGDVILFTPHKGDTIAQIIAFLTNGKVHHAAICYSEDTNNNDKYLMESLIGEGLVINNLREKEQRTFPAYVARLKNEDLSLFPVLDVAAKYYKVKNHYPIPNVVILAILLLVKRLPQEILNKSSYYTLLVCVGALLMDIIRKRVNNTSSMICSQFVMQCFSDVEEPGYKLKFDKLVVLDGLFPSCRENSISMLECLSHNPNIGEEPIVTKAQELDLSILFQEFKDDISPIMENTAYSSPKISIDKKNLSVANQLKKLLDTFFKEFLKVPFTLENSSELLNYLVTPQDLYENTPSLSIIGTIDYADVLTR